jgi:hypothetical protein
VDNRQTDTEKPYVLRLGITYPDVPDTHMIPPKKEIDLVVDENYPFLDKSIGFRIRSALLYLGIFVIVFFISPIRFGLRIEGRKVLKKYRTLLRNGALTAEPCCGSRPTGKSWSLRESPIIRILVKEIERYDEKNIPRRILFYSLGVNTPPQGLNLTHNSMIDYQSPKVETAKTHRTRARSRGGGFSGA